MTEQIRRIHADPAAPTASRAWPVAAIRRGLTQYEPRHTLSEGSGNQLITIRCGLLDYTTNGDVTDTTSPLSHAALVSRYVADRLDNAEQG